MNIWPEHRGRPQPHVTRAFQHHQMLWAGVAEPYVEIPDDLLLGRGEGWADNGYAVEQFHPAAVVGEPQYIFRREAAGFGGVEEGEAVAGLDGADGQWPVGKAPAGGLSGG